MIHQRTPARPHVGRLRDVQRCTRRVVRLAVALLAAGLLLAAPAWGRPAGKPFSLGLGLAGTHVAGGLDGQRVVTNGGTGGVSSYLGKPGAGEGSLLTGGMTLSPTMGLELLLLSTRHHASHQSLPRETLHAHMGSLLGMVRMMLPVGEDVEVFGRLGAGPVLAGYSDGSRLGTSSGPLSAALSGLSLAAGGGITVFFGPLGLELAALEQRARLSEITAAQETVASFHNVYLNLGTVTLTLTVHFGLQ